MVESKKSTKEKAAAARAAAEAEQRKRDRRIQIIGGAVIAVLVAGIIAVGVIGSRGGSDASTGVVADAAVPTGTFTSGDNAWGIPVNTTADVPVLSIWEDFGCPACATFEARLGTDIQKLAADGTVQLVYRTTTFIEKNYPQSPNPDSSTRAANAYGCAVDAGKGTEVHNIIFENQPPIENEGDGWTDDQLLQFGKDGGITGDAYTTYETCVKDVKYRQWTVNSYTVFRESSVPGTPAVFLNGTEVPTEALATIDALKKYIADNK